MQLLWYLSFCDFKSLARTTSHKLECFDLLCDLDYIFSNNHPILIVFENHTRHSSLCDFWNIRFWEIPSPLRRKCCCFINDTWGCTFFSFHDDGTFPHNIPLSLSITILCFDLLSLSVFKKVRRDKNTDFGVSRVGEGMRLWTVISSTSRKRIVLEINFRPFYIKIALQRVVILFVLFFLRAKITMT